MQSTDNPSFSYRWDLFVPIVVAVTPAILFMSLGFITRGMDKPGVKPAEWQIAAVVALEVVGIVSMAFVMLTRAESGFRRLFLRTMGRPAAWRRLCLFLAMIFLLLFDVLINVGAAFAGAEPMMVAACPMFVAYLVFRWISFAGL